MTDKDVEKEELERAKQTIAAMSPEEFLELEKYILSLEARLPEAPASANFSAMSATGYQTQFTLRDNNETQLLERLQSFQLLIEAEGYRDLSRQVTKTIHEDGKEVVSEINLTELRIPDGLENIDDLEPFVVDAVSHVVTNSGKHHLKVFGGYWQKYGWSAWEEVIPTPEWINWSIGEKKTPPKELAVAWFSKEKKKVLAFSSQTEL